MALRLSEGLGVTLIAEVAESNEDVVVTLARDTNALLNGRCVSGFVRKPDLRPIRPRKELNFNGHPQAAFMNRDLIGQLAFSSWSRGNVFVPAANVQIVRALLYFDPDSPVEAHTFLFDQRSGQKRPNEETFVIKSAEVVVVPGSGVSVEIVQLVNCVRKLEPPVRG